MNSDIRTENTRPCFLLYRLPELKLSSDLLLTRGKTDSLNDLFADQKPEQ